MYLLCKYLENIVLNIFFFNFSITIIDDFVFNLKSTYECFQCYILVLSSSYQTINNYNLNRCLFKLIVIKLYTYDKKYNNKLLK